MKRIVVGLLAVCLLGSLTVLAEEKATAEKAVKKDVVLQDITATGKLAKHAMGFTVTEADGTVTMVKVMAKKAAKEGETSVADLEKLVGKDVKVVGVGTTKTSKAGKKTSVIKTVTSIEEATVPAAPAEAPAVPAAPAAPAAAPEAE